MDYFRAAYLSMNRWKRRQVLDCGDEVFEVAALDWESAGLDKPNRSEMPTLKR